jgi:hypothetical protein
LVEHVPGIIEPKTVHRPPVHGLLQAAKDEALMPPGWIEQPTFALPNDDVGHQTLVQVQRTTTVKEESAMCEQFGGLANHTCAKEASLLMVYQLSVCQYDHF